ncbi:MAG: hypothetical protein UU47_C0007G0005 [candidate division TM6 bacterium GW2011_GWE2_41_16]|nr:MAG: hypothetical protein UU47_C0007G0005 [candidate division TM6 bacterium GW2011_GWE2_41_16]
MMHVFSQMRFIAKFTKTYTCEREKIALKQSFFRYVCSGFNSCGCKSFVLALCSLSAFQSVYGMFDSRYGVPPITERPYFREYRKYHFGVEPFLMIAADSYGICDDVGLYDIHGRYDLFFLDEALRLAQNTPSLMRPDWSNVSMMPYCLDGTFSAQGINFVGRAYLFDFLSIGFKVAYLHAQAAVQYLFDDHSNLHLQGPGDAYDLRELKNRLHNIYCLKPPVWSQNMFSDMDLYARLGFMREYWQKFRKLDVGFQAGVLVPFAKQKIKNQPLSVPLGGNKAFGMYMMLDIDAILKEDVHAGCWFRMQKRISKTYDMRLPIYREPADMGVLEGCLNVSPGVTFGVCPYVAIEHMRGGFGCYAAYTGIFHMTDTFCDRRADTSKKINFEHICDASNWSSDFITIGALYDTASECDDESTRKPIFGLFWDIPIGFIGGKHAFKTYGISLRGELQF